MRLLLLSSLLLNIALLVAGYLAVQRLGGWTYLQYRFAQRGLTAHYAMRAQQFEALPVTTGGTVVLGNSLIEQGLWSEWLGRPVRNRGIAGDHVEALLARLETVEVLEPDTLFVLIGVNDLLFHPPEHVLELYESLQYRLDTNFPDTKIFWLSVLPVNNTVRDTKIDNAAIESLNTILRDRLTTSRITFIDAHSALLNADNRLTATYTDDGIHLNGAGYRVLAGLLEELD